MDIEISKWGEKDKAVPYLQYVIQPHPHIGNIDRTDFHFAALHSTTTRHSITWRTDNSFEVASAWLTPSKEFEVYRYRKFHDYTLSHGENERLHINLWQLLGREPNESSVKQIELVDFAFTPEN